MITYNIYHPSYFFYYHHHNYHHQQLYLSPSLLIILSKAVYLIHPNGTYKTWWDILIALLVIGSIIVEPLKLSFYPPSDHSLDNLEWLVTSVFMVDMMLNFITGYEDKQTDQIIFNLSLIRLNYLKFWFWIDLISTLPLDSIVGLFIESQSQLFAVRIIRIIRLFRLFKLYNLVGIDELVENAKINPAIISLVILVIQMMFLAHILACLWHGIGVPNFIHSHTWINEFGYFEAEIGTKYVLSLYYIIVTMLTIGFGEIHPVNSTERLFATLLMFSGGITFGSLINKLTTFLNQRNPQAKAFKLHMNELKSYLIDFNFPQELSIRVKVLIKLLLCCVFISSLLSSLSSISSRSSSSISSPSLTSSLS